VALLGKPQGVFDLTDSDRCVGSYFSKRDVATILNVPLENLSQLPFRLHDGMEVIDERLLQKSWYRADIQDAPPAKKTSLDEVVLKAIIHAVYQDALVESQVPVARYQVDLKITVRGKTLFVEFDGPSHFSLSQYGFPKDIRVKKNRIQDSTGIELVNWPYWIQRCASNLRSLFEPNISGFGALWSTEVHFGMFVFEDSATIIETLTSRFNAVDGEGFGYFYGPNTRGRNNPQHPIVDEIRSGKRPREILIPKGYKVISRWLPTVLQ